MENYIEYNHDRWFVVYKDGVMRQKYRKKRTANTFAQLIGGTVRRMGIFNNQLVPMENIKVTTIKMSEDF